MHTQNNPIDLLNRAKELAYRELEILCQNNDDSLSLADEYSSERSILILQAWESQQEDSEDFPLFKERLQELYTLQEELIVTAENIKLDINKELKLSQRLRKRLSGYQYSLGQELNKEKSSQSF
ncbi:MAG: hypothetical protein ACRCV3_03120 [Desulfovibrionaceae bacterium]